MFSSVNISYDIIGIVCDSSICAADISEFLINILDKLNGFEIGPYSRKSSTCRRETAYILRKSFKSVQCERKVLRVSLSLVQCIFLFYK